MRINKTRDLLHQLDFQQLFREELGWGNPVRPKLETATTAKGVAYTRLEIAHLGGASVYEVSTPDGTIPNASERAHISQVVQRTQLVHILIFVDAQRTQCVWRWMKRDGKKEFPREHLYIKGQPGDLFLAKLSPLFVDISQLNAQGSLPILEVSQRIEKALDMKPVTKKFYRDYQQQHIQFLDLITGIPDEADRRWYASVLLNRLMFIYFLQKKFFIDGGNDNYLADKFAAVQAQYGEGHYYSLFLDKLFFEGFAIPEKDRSAETNALIGRVKYLNGGLFLRHKIEVSYEGAIQIPDIAFANLLNLFKSYTWMLNDIPGENDNEINPDVLGYIFEKYINQKAFGAYYTPPEITDYLCEQTVYKLILAQVNGDELPASVPAPLAQKLARRRYADVPELLINLDADTCRRLVVGPNAILPNLSLLDPSCGSGAFLVAAMKTLINIYAGVLGRITVLSAPDLTAWKAAIEREHPSVNYFIKKQIITNNLYGVDLMEEATEIAKLRLFLTLVAAAEKETQLEPLPNIDFNIMPGNSLIGLMRVDENAYSKIKGADLFAKSYRQLVQEKEAAIAAYRSSAVNKLQALRDSIDVQRTEAVDVLNLMLGQEFTNLGIQYEQVTWDTKTNKPGKSLKRKLNATDIRALEPFHWGYEFSDIFRKKDGFDAIITNPPWETVKPIAREFFQSHSDVVTRRGITIKQFEEQQEELLQQPEIRQAWLQYLSGFPHQSQYYRTTKQYINQISVVNGKKAGTDINLYKLFTEQCYNLLRPSGYCGIVIPSGIYSDLGAKQLRKLLFEQTAITGLFCFENRKEIFEGVHRSFKFVVLSFEKGGQTMQFPAAFMRHNVADLETFPDNGATTVSVNFIKRQSPDSWSIAEIKNKIESKIIGKMLSFPLLGDAVAGQWAFKLTREFDMTNDSNLFQSQSNSDSLPLYEGKIIDHFRNDLAKPKYWIAEESGRKALIGREAESNQLLDYQSHRLGIRSITGATNWRTLICSILPKNVFCGNSLQTTRDNINQFSGGDLLFINSVLSSFVIDSYLRRSVLTNVNMFYVYQLPVPRLRAGDAGFAELVKRAAKLICTTPEFADLWNEVMPTPWTTASGVTDVPTRNTLRAEIDAIVAGLYGLTEAEFSYILGTFPLVAEAQKTLTLTKFQRLQTQAAMKPATIFMSYAHEDAAPVEQLYQALVSLGFQVWKDDYQLLPGENWEHKIELALKQHEFVIVCLSATSVKKRGFFQVELKKAARKQAERSVSDVYIIPVKLSDYNAGTLPSEINAIQYVDLSQDFAGGVSAIEKTIQTYRRP